MGMIFMLHFFPDSVSSQIAFDSNIILFEAFTRQLTFHMRILTKKNSSKEKAYASGSKSHNVCSKKTLYTVMTNG